MYSVVWRKPIKSNLAIDGKCEKAMTQKQIAEEEELLVSLTFHNFSAEMLKEFAVKIVRPYFNGNINEAIRSLMQKSIEEEEIVSQSIKKSR